MGKSGNHVPRGWANAPAVVLATATSLFLLSTGGCLSGPDVTGIIHESGSGSVFLEEMPRLAREASHPVSVEPSTLARVLQGVQVREQLRGVFPAGTDEPATAPAFSEDDIGFLAPLLSRALGSAGRSDHVSFRVLHSRGSRPLVTAGTLYAHGPFLYLTLTHFHYAAHNPGILYQTRTRLPYSTALTRQTLRFIPETAGRATDTHPLGPAPHPTLTTLVIDYQLVAELEKSQTAKKRADRKDAELRALKREVQALKKKLAERDKLIRQD